MTIHHLYKTVDDFTRVYIDKNISNVVSKAKQHPLIIKEILFGKEVPFTNFDETLKFLYVNGVIEDCEGICCIQIPIYKKALFSAFKPLINGEKDYFIEPFRRMEAFQNKDGSLKEVVWDFALSSKLVHPILPHL